MGNTAPRLKPEEVEQYAHVAAGKFSKKEIQALYEQFVQISTLEDGQTQDLINEREFHLAMGFKAQSFILKRMFEVFDENGDGGITFSEFLKGLSALSGKASEQEKMKFSFRLYDVNKDGKITKEELKTMLAGSVSALPYRFSEAEMDELVDRTFAETDLNGNGYISYAEYTKLIASHPRMLQQMTVNVSQAIAQRKARLKYMKKHPESVVATAAAGGGAASGSGSGGGGKRR
jgi:serine/threonine-protein phosphatase 2B regulatory subunit